MSDPESMLPNLLILGAAKSGTSSLYMYMDQHPDVFMSGFKEPHFFIWDGRDYDVKGPGVDRVGRRVIRDLDSYLKLFSGATRERIRGEASTGYLHTVGAAERIRTYVPHAKLIAILRNPVDRAYSAFLHAQREGLEPLADFEQALQEEPHRVAEGWIGLTLYTTVGMYAEQLDRYLAVFPCEQLKVYLFDELIGEPVRVAQDAFRYLGVDDTFRPDVSAQANRGSAVRSVRLRSIVRWVRRSSLVRRLPSGPARAFLRAINERPMTPLSPKVRRRLARVFEPDVTRLSHMLGRDLAPWLKGDKVPGKPGDELGAHPCR
jgi:sulfotransferase family protein